VRHGRPKIDPRAFRLAVQILCADNDRILPSAIPAMSSSILRAQQLGITTFMIPVVYLTFNLVYFIVCCPCRPGGGQVWQEAGGAFRLYLFVIIYYGFAVAGSATAPGYYSLCMAFSWDLRRVCRRHFLTTIIPPDFKATAFVFTIPPSVSRCFRQSHRRLLWDHVSPGGDILYGAAMAAVSTLLFILFIALVGRQTLIRKFVMVTFMTDTTF